MNTHEGTPRNTPSEEGGLSIDTVRFGVDFHLLLSRWSIEWQKERSDRFWIRCTDNKNIAYLVWNSRKKENGYKNAEEYVMDVWWSPEIERYTEGFRYSIVDTQDLRGSTQKGFPYKAINYELAVDIEGDAGHNFLFFFVNVPGDVWHWGTLSNHGNFKKPLGDSLIELLDSVSLYQFPAL